MANPKLNDLRIGHLSYNGFTFPALTDIGSTFRAVYNETETAVKWYEIEINVSFIYYPTAEDGSVNVAAGRTYDSSSQLPQYMDDLVADLRRRLLQPGQLFSMNSVGLGTINNPTDLNGGPKPTDCQIAPVATNICSKVTWKCSLRIAPGCISNANFNGIVSLNYDVTWEQNESESFQFVRTISGEIEFLNNRLVRPGQLTAGANQQSLDLAVKQKLYPILAQLFPKPRGYERSRRLGLGANNRTLTFTITDSEIMLDVPPPRPILKMRLRNPVQSDISKGFSEWRVGFVGEITVAKARNNNNTSFSSQKRAAWVILGQLIAKRLQLANGKFMTVPTGATTAIRSVKIILESIQIEDLVNEAGFSFNLQYRLICNQKLIVAASGLFSTLGLPGETWERRQQYLDSIQAEADAIIPWPVDQPPVFDLCSNPILPNAYSSNEDKHHTFPNQLEEPTSKGNPVEDAYLRFENAYYVEEENMSSVHIPLYQQESRREVVRGNDPAGLVPVSDSSFQPQAPLPIVTNPTARVYYVTMVGKSSKAGTPATPPNLTAYGGKPCIKVGKDQIYVRERVVGVVLNPNETSTTIYNTQWIKKYLVYGNLPPNQVAYRTVDRVSASPAYASSQQTG